MDTLIIIAGTLLILFVSFLLFKALKPEPDVNPPKTKDPEQGQELDQTRAIIEVLRTRTKGHFKNEEQLQNFLRHYGRDSYDAGNAELRALLDEVRRNYY